MKRNFLTRDFLYFEFEFPAFSCCLLQPRKMSKSIVIDTSRYSRSISSLDLSLSNSITPPKSIISDSNRLFSSNFIVKSIKKIYKLRQFSSIRKMAQTTTTSFLDWHRGCPKCSTYPSTQSHSLHRASAVIASTTASFNDYSSTSISTTPRNLFRPDLSTIDTNAAMIDKIPNYVSLSRCFEGAGYIDTHCHLDLLFDKDGHRGTYGEFMAMRKSTWAKCYEGCITDFCFPESYMVDDRWETILKDPNVYGAFGCHPHSANMYTDELDQVLSARLHHPKVIAIGEMGLDYSQNNHVDHDEQKSAFRRQLIMGVELQKPIVIHCRDAEEDCFEIMKELVPRDHPIHRHCFLGSIEDANRLIEHFTSLKIGLTTYAVSQTSGPFMRIIRDFPLDKVLIETDTPYFLPRYFRTAECGNLQWNHPGMGFLVGAKLADERNITLVDLLKRIRENTREVYGI